MHADPSSTGANILVSKGTQHKVAFPTSKMCPWPVLLSVTLTGSTPVEQNMDWPVILPMDYGTGLTALKWQSRASSLKATWSFFLSFFFFFFFHNYSVQHPHYEHRFRHFHCMLGYFGVFIIRLSLTCLYMDYWIFNVLVIFLQARAHGDLGLVSPEELCCWPVRVFLFHLQLHPKHL